MTWRSTFTFCCRIQRPLSMRSCLMKWNYSLQVRVQVAPRTVVCGSVRKQIASCFVVSWCTSRFWKQFPKSCLALGKRSQAVEKNYKPTAHSSVDAPITKAHGEHVATYQKVYKADDAASVSNLLIHHNICSGQA
jgi:hypothetical protein